MTQPRRPLARPLEEKEEKEEVQEEAQPSEPAAEGEDTQAPPEAASGSQAQEPEEPAREGDKEDGQTTETEKASDTDSNVSTDVSAPLPFPRLLSPPRPLPHLQVLSLRFVFLNLMPFSSFARKKGSRSRRSSSFLARLFILQVFFYHHR